MSKETYQIRCKECGYTTEKFHGWVFATSQCPTPGQPNMLHKWEAVGEVGITPEQRNAFYRASNLLKAGHLEEGMEELAESGIVEKHIDEDGTPSYSMKPEYAAVIRKVREEGRY